MNPRCAHTTEVDVRDVVAGWRRENLICKQEALLLNGCIRREVE
jgi:hypothetical protein